MAQSPVDHRIRNLDISVCDLLSSSAAEINVSDKLFHENIVLVGDLVSQDEDALFRRLRVRPATRQRIKSALEKIGVSFGMDTSDWRRPSVIPTSFSPLSLSATTLS